MQCEQSLAHIRVMMHVPMKDIYLFYNGFNQKSYSFFRIHYNECTHCSKTNTKWSTYALKGQTNTHTLS